MHICVQLFLFACIWVQLSPLVPFSTNGTLFIVAIVLGGAFGSLLVPLRAVVCICWMLIIVFGAAVLVYQDELLRGLHWPALGFAGSGANSWMAPCVAFSILVGLGLDYDIFLVGAKSGFGHPVQRNTHVEPYPKSFRCLQRSSLMHRVLLVRLWMGTPLSLSTASANKQTASTTYSV